MKVIAVDSSQIEARITGWLAEHKTLLELFSDERRDVYAEMGTQFFGREITKEAATSAVVLTFPQRDVAVRRQALHKKIS